MDAPESPPLSPGPPSSAIREVSARPLEPLWLTILFLIGTIMGECWAASPLFLVADFGVRPTPGGLLQVDGTHLK